MVTQFCYPHNFDGQLSPGATEGDAASELPSSGEAKGSPRGSTHVPRVHSKAGGEGRQGDSWYLKRTPTTIRNSNASLQGKVWGKKEEKKDRQTSPDSWQFLSEHVPNAET